MASITYYYHLPTITGEDIKWIMETFEGRATATTTYDTIDITSPSGYKMKMPTSLENEVHITTEEDRAVFLLKFPEAYMYEMAYHPDEAI